MTTKKPKKEVDVMREICEWLAEMDLVFWRMNNIPALKMSAGGQRIFRSLPKYTPRGLPDICVVLPKGKFVAIEAKREGAKLKPQQAEWGSKLVTHTAGVYIVAHSLLELKEKMRDLL